MDSGGQQELWAGERFSGCSFINKLAGLCGEATNYKAPSHPSLPNYIALPSGSTQGIADDAEPSAHPLNVDSIFSQLNGDWRGSLQLMCSTRWSFRAPRDRRHRPGGHATVEIRGRRYPCWMRWTQSPLWAAWEFCQPWRAHSKRTAGWAGIRRSRRQRSGVCCRSG
jgi:hypothetical protein